MEEKTIIVLLIIVVTITIVKMILDDIKYKKKLNTIKNETDNNVEFQEDNEEIERKIDYKLPYHSKYLLTKNEFYFYKKLKPIADSKNLQILAKIRLADLIEVNSGLNKSEWGKYFSKIKSKHIDFAIADNMKIIALIELDDSSHQKDERVVRDTFVNAALTSAGYTVVRTSGDLSYIQHIIDDYKVSLRQI